MSLSLSQVVVGTSAVPLGTLTENSSVTIAVPGSGQTVFVGTASTVTAASGFPVTSGGPPVTFTLPAASTPAVLYGIVAGTTQATGLAFATTS
jgi:hypothetical protein